MQKITKYSAAEYFSKNLQQVGFSSLTKAVLTTLKESVDNSLDACEDAGIPPEIKITIRKEGQGSSKNADLISIVVEDNGPGLEEKNIKRVFGEYLASSKFGKGRCSRGQQGIGISAAVTWAQLTNAKGVYVISKTKDSKRAVSVTVNMDIKNNKGVLKDKKKILLEDNKEHGLRLEFLIDGRIQLNGDGGLLTYLEGTALLNPHLEMEYSLPGKATRRLKRLSSKVPKVPPPTLPHPHTMQLGEFLQHAGLYGKISLKKFLKTGFSRVSDKSLKEMRDKGLSIDLLNQPLTGIGEGEYKKIFSIIQQSQLTRPSTQSVLAVGEEGLAESVHRLGEIDFFSVIARKPKICDFKSVVVEAAIARLKDRGKDRGKDKDKGKNRGSNRGSNREKDREEDTVQLLRFANRAPLQFDKASCAITKAIESVNWRSYGLSQAKKSLPKGPFVFAVSVTSPFIKFKNASKETIEAGFELVEEIRLALMQAGQKLKKHIRREKSAGELFRKKEYIEKFAPILIKKIKDITGVGEREMKRGEKGLYAILSKDTAQAEKALGEAKRHLEEMKSKSLKRVLNLKTQEDLAEQEAVDPNPQKLEPVASAKELKSKAVASNQQKLEPVVSAKELKSKAVSPNQQKLKQTPSSSQDLKKKLDRQENLKLWPEN